MTGAPNPGKQTRILGFNRLQKKRRRKMKVAARESKVIMEYEGNEGEETNRSEGSSAEPQKHEYSRRF